MANAEVVSIFHTPNVRSILTFILFFFCILCIRPQNASKKIEIWGETTSTPNAPRKKKYWARKSSRPFTQAQHFIIFFFFAAYIFILSRQYILTPNYHSDVA